MLLVLTVMRLSILLASPTCQSSSTSSSILYQQEGFLESTATSGFGVKVGTKTNNFYFLYYLFVSAVAHSTIRRVNQNYNAVWTADFSKNLYQKSLSVDLAENYVYFATQNYPITVFQLNAANGLMASGQQYQLLQGISQDIKIHLFTDSSGYLIVGCSSDSYAMICKYLHSTSNNAECQKILTIYNYLRIQLMLSNTELFIAGYEPNPSNNLRFCKITFGKTSVDWGMKMQCLSPPCLMSISNGVVTNNIIYNLFTFDSILFLYFAAFKVADGSIIGSRYKSNSRCQYAYGSAASNGYVIFTANCDSISYLILTNASISEFTLKKFSGTTLYECAVDKTSGRFIIIGNTNVNAYLTIFMATSVNYHPSFSSSSLSLVPLPDGTNDIAPDISVSISSIIGDTITITSTPNVAVTYFVVLGSTYISDVSFQTNDQTISVSENSITQLLPDLPCSSSGSTSIVYSLVSYSGAIVPSWIAIDSASGLLNISAPEVSADTSNYFYIKSVITGSSDPLLNLVKLTILNCVAQNCEKCSNQGAAICSLCKSEYALSSGSCVKQISDTAYKLSVTIQLVFATTIVIVLVNTVINESSSACLWSFLNQIQMYFLLLITRAYIPFDIQTVITGPNFVLNPYEYIPFKKIGISFIESFKFDLTNELLDRLNIKSDSTIYNMYHFICFMIIIGCIHLLIFIPFILISRCKFEGRCAKFMKFINWIIVKIIEILTFGYYIRSILAINQYLLISTINEIYEWNVTQTLRTISLIIAFISLVVNILLIKIMFLLSISSYKLIEGNHNKLGEIFTGLKTQNKFRIYTPILMTRRMIYVLILISIISISSKIVIGILSAIQIGYEVYILYLRPFSRVKDNIIEILLETYFLVLLFGLIFLNASSDWSSFIISAYMWIIASSNMVVLLITLTDLLINLVIKLKKTCKAPIAAKKVQLTPQINLPKTLKRQPISINLENNELQPNSHLQLYEENKQLAEQDSSYVGMIKSKTELEDCLE